MDTAPVEDFRVHATNLADSIASQVPSLALALLVIVAGWLIARVVRAVARRAVDGVDQLLDRVFRRGTLAGARVSPAITTVVGEVAFWATLLFAVVIAADMAGLVALTAWAGRVVTHLPQLIVGLAIIVIGYFVSLVVRERVGTQGTGQDGRLGRIAQAATFAVALLVGLDQIGIDVAVVLVLLGAGLGGLVIGLAVAFGMGARNHISNLIGARAARNHLSAGLRVRIGEIEGVILEITASQIALDTDRGKVLLPARVCDEQPVLIVTEREEEAPHV